MKTAKTTSINIYIKNKAWEEKEPWKILEVIDNSENAQFYMDQETILKITGFTHKRLYLYLLRNKDISQVKYKNKVLIDLRSMLRYMGKNVRISTKNIH